MERGVGEHAEAGVRLDRFQRFPEQQDLGVGDAGKDLEGAGEVELRHAREDQAAKAELGHVVGSFFFREESHPCGGPHLSSPPAGTERDRYQRRDV